MREFIFISHDSDDNKTAEDLCERLEEEGFRCWLARRDIDAGINWGEAIISAIENSSIMILVFSARANDSVHVLREVERAVHHRLHVILFRVEDVPLAKSLEYYLSTPQWLDAFKLPLNDCLQRLVKSLHNYFRDPGKPTHRPTLLHERLRPAISIETGDRIARLVLLAHAGYPDDVDAIMEAVPERFNPSSEDALDFVLSHLRTLAGQRRLKHYLIGGNSGQRKLAALYFKRILGGPGLMRLMHALQRVEAI